MDPTDEQARARGRRDWPIEIHNLEQSISEDLSKTTTAEERLAMMWPLAVEAWRVAGKVLPDYSRDEMPSRMVRGNRFGDPAGSS